MLSLARLLASDGFAVLTYDKRGVGKSGGVYEEPHNTSAANIDLLADDAAAAMQVLTEHPRLASVLFGFIGESQGGWIVPIASLKSRAPKFMAFLSGPVCTVSEQMHFQDLAGNDEAFWTTHTHAQVATYMKSVSYSSDDVDPRSSLSTLSMPGLWLFGAKDNLVPVDVCEARLKTLIQQGQHNFSYKIYPDFGHQLGSGPSKERLAYRDTVTWIKNLAKPQ
jgi:hypothetical protein